MLGTDFFLCLTLVYSNEIPQSEHTSADSDMCIVSQFEHMIILYCTVFYLQLSSMSKEFH